MEEKSERDAFWLVRKFEEVSSAPGKREILLANPVESFRQGGIGQLMLGERNGKPRDTKLCGKIKKGKEQLARVPFMQMSFLQKIAKFLLMQRPSYFMSYLFFPFLRGGRFKGKHY